MLTKTSERDKDQVVSRRARKELREAKKELQEINGGRSGHSRKVHIPESHNMLMVDQLWLWIIRARTDSEPDTVITSFPNREGVRVRDSRTVDDLQATVLRSQNMHPRDPISDTTGLVSRILTVCCSTLDRHQSIKTVEFLQMFQNTIGDAVGISYVGPHNFGLYERFW